MKTVLKMFLFVLLSLQVSTNLFSQDIYEVKFTTKDRSYKGLLVFFSDSKMYMRVAYFKNEKYYVVNVDYSSEHGTSDDGTEYLALVGSNPKFITEQSSGKYNPDHLFFLGDDELPIVSFDLEDPDNIVVADAFREITKADVTDKYLREFYKSNEADYLALRKMFGLEKAPTKPVATTNTNTNNNNTNTNNNNNNNTTSNKPVTLHLIVTANTAISDIGQGCDVDKRNLEAEFRGIASTLGIGFKKYIVEGEGFTKTNTLNTINSLNPGSNDIVVFFYRGHGFRWADQTETWPQLDYRSNSYIRLDNNTTLGLSEVYNKIIAKGARLNLVLGDCCNNSIGISQVTNNNFLTRQGGNNNYNDTKLSDLFIKSKGNLISCAASPGEYSWVNSATGGFYTTGFLQALREEISYLRNDSADWEDLLKNTIKNAKQKTNGCSNCTPQNGKYFNGVK